ncbi:MAG: hypothetical protein SFZ23_13490 [Planctomycetota bacterium]|nr:hypothetical protein [Planctomycetota bacterium]
MAGGIGFGTFQATGKTLPAGRGSKRAYVASPAGDPNAARYVIKALLHEDLVLAADASAQLQLFLETSTLLAEMGRASADSSWAKIHHQGEAPFGVAHVMDLYPLSVSQVCGIERPTHPELQNVVRQTLLRLQELKRSKGRAHGNLRPSNVLLTSPRLDRTSVVLDDPAPRGLMPQDAEREDLADVGRMIFWLVTKRNDRSDVPVPIDRSADWGASSPLGSLGSKWFDVCSRLLEPAGKPPAIDDLLAEISAWKAATVAPWKIGVAAAAALVVLGGGGFLAWRATSGGPTVVLTVSVEDVDNNWQRLLDYEVWSAGLDRSNDPILGEDRFVRALAALRSVQPRPRRYVELESTEVRAFSEVSASNPARQSEYRALVDQKKTLAEAVSAMDAIAKSMLERPELVSLEQLAARLGERGASSPLVRRVSESLTAAITRYREIVTVRPASGEALTDLDARNDFRDAKRNAYGTQNPLVASAKELVAAYVAAQGLERSLVQAEQASASVRAAAQALEESGGAGASGFAVLKQFDTLLASLTPEPAANAPAAQLARELEAALQGFAELGQRLEARLRQSVEGGAQPSGASPRWYAALMASDAEHLALDGEIGQALSREELDRWLALSAQPRFAEASGENPVTEAAWTFAFPGLGNRTILEAITQGREDGDELHADDAARKAASGQAFDELRVRVQELRTRRWVASEAEGIRAGRVEVERTLDTLLAETSSIREARGKSIEELLAKARGEAPVSSPGAVAAWNQVVEGLRDIRKERIGFAAGNAAGVFRSLNDAFIAAQESALRGDALAALRVANDPDASPSGWRAGLREAIERQVRADADAALSRLASDDQTRRALASRTLTPGPEAAKTWEAALRQTNAWLESAGRVAGAASRVERALSLGFGASESAEGSTIADLRQSLQSEASFEALRAALATVTNDADALLTAESASDIASLEQTAREHPSPAVRMASWRRLGAIDEWSRVPALDRERQVQEAVAAAVAKIPDQARVQALREELDRERAKRWARAFERAASSAEIDGAMQVRDAFTGGVMPEVSPAARFNAMLHELSRAQSTLSDADVRGRLQTFVADARGLGLDRAGGDAGARANALLDKLQRIIDDKKPTGTPPDKAGPATVGWSGTANGATVVFTLPRPVGDGPVTLEFAPVPGTQGVGGNEITYLGVTEVSIRQFAGIMASSQEDLSELLAGRPILVQSWSEAERSAGFVQPGRVGEWRTGGGWIRVGVSLSAEQRATLDAATGDAPSWDSPMQNITLGLAVYASRLAGARLPTAKEWADARAAVSTGSDDLGDANLRDGAWKRLFDARKTLTDMKAGAWPGEGVFGGGAIKPEDDSATWSRNDEQALFRPVGQGSGLFRNLVGNVAEFVITEATNQAELAPAEAWKLANNRLSRASWAGVVGQSALSPPVGSGDVGKVGPVERAASGYADVGFRLAFRAAPMGAVSPRDQLAGALADQPYIFASR